MLKCDLMKDGECRCKKPCVKIINYNKGFTDGVKEFGEWLADNGFESSCHTIESWIKEFMEKDLIYKVKGQKNDNT